jgi:flagellin
VKDDYDVTVDGDTITLTAKTAGGAGSEGPTAVAGTYTVTGSKGTATFTTVEAGADKGATSTSSVVGNTLVDYNVSTTNINTVTSAGTNRLASTYFDLTKDMTADGATLTIGHETYQFTTNKDNIGKTADDGSVYVDATSGDLDTIAKKLTEAAASNDVFSVGHDGSRITVTEQLDYAKNMYDNDDTSATYGKFIGSDKDFDLSSEEGFAKALSFTGAVTTGKSLMLQIGDTSESYNQLSVSIEDMHAAALGIDGIDISNQEGASAAINVIKEAINKVSSTRGTLGATQNRLEHTANNLSVMSENIQDAESTIRDTDIAEEMMSYTKNNILVQSAQAMLAQANSVPQGVLQLLQ